jgi:hypothetical protein
MGTPILEVICFAIVALALVAPRLILHLMRDRPAQSGEKTSSDARRRSALRIALRTGRRDQAASG